MSPRWAKAVRNSASGVTTRRSQHSANGNAMPATAPLTAAMIGLSIVIRYGNRPPKSPSRRSRGRPIAAGRPSAAAVAALGDKLLSRFMSAPAQNARPAPVTTMPTTARSAAARRSASLISASIPFVHAFSEAGRFEGDDGHRVVDLVADLVVHGLVPRRRSAARRLHVQRSVPCHSPVGAGGSEGRRTEGQAGAPGVDTCVKLHSAA